MPTPKGAQRTVIFLMALAVGFAVGRRAVSDVPRSEIVRPRVLVGGLIATVFLLVTAERAPRLATGMALIIAITATMSSNELLERLNLESSRIPQPARNPQNRRETQ